MKEIGYRNFKRHGKSYVIRFDRETDIAYDECYCCGKMLTKTYYSVQAEDGLEYLYGSGCYRKLEVAK